MSQNAENVLTMLVAALSILGVVWGMSRGFTRVAASIESVAEQLREFKELVKKTLDKHEEEIDDLKKRATYLEAHQPRSPWPPYTRGRDPS